MVSPEKINGQPLAPSSAPDRVLQPQSRPLNSIGLSDSLGMILEEVNRISEQAKEGPSEQWSSGNGGLTTSASGAGSTTVSARDQAIANLPDPKIMQKELEKHIRTEVKKLRKQALSIARMSHPGAAYRLNALYARIRNLNALLSELLDASYEAIRRFFIRVFIDKQHIL